MKNSPIERVAISNIFREIWSDIKYRIIFFSLCVVSLAAPLYGIYFIMPSFTRELIEITEDDATRTAHYLSDNLFKNKLSGQQPKPWEVSQVLENFNIYKIKYFASSGEIMFSTDLEDIGTINTKDYFTDIVVKGGVFTKIVKKGSQSAEGREMEMDVAEIYIPTMKGNTFVGAFELYYNITVRKKNLDLLLYRSTAITVISSILFFLISILFLFNASRDNLKGKILSNQIRDFNDTLKRQVAEQTEDLRSSNSLLKAVIEGTTDAIFLKNLNGQYLLANSSTLKAIGKTEHEVIGKDDRELFPEKSAKIINAADSSVMQSGQPRIAEEQLETACGVSYWLANKSPHRDAAGNIIGIIGISRDISDQKRIEGEKKKLQEQLMQAQKMESIGTLAGGIAHDFNNILSSIIGFTELALEAAPAGSSQRDDLEEVFIAGNRAKELVQQILAFARQSAEKTKPVRLSDIVTEVLKLLRPSTPTTIDIKPTFNSTAKVIGSVSQLHQIIMNLCTNAVHSLQKSGGVLEIGLRDVSLVNDSGSTTSELPEGEYVELTVTDNGMGIDPAIIENIFEPYFTTKGVGEGTGMGLAMVKGIVESYHGNIHVKSEPGKKTSFVISLPVATGKRIEEVGQVAQVASGTERILFVDDEPPIARMGSRILESLGYTVTIRTCSIEALELFRERPDAFDLVITDMTMPSMTGDELSMEIRKIREDIPVILCTGFSNKMNEENAKLIGIEAFAYKPFTKSDFAKAIREVLDKKRTSLG